MSQENTHDLSVKSIHVQRLFGMYNHDIVLKQEHATIVFGRNGVGKTAIFKLTHGLLGGGVSGLANLLRCPYEKFQVVFSNDDRVEARRPIDGTGTKIQIAYVESDGTEKLSVQVTEQEFVKQAKRIEARSPTHQVSPDRWLDPETGETLDAFEMVERWGSMGGDDETQKIKEWRDLLLAKRVPQTLFIQAQRLIQVVRNRNRLYRGGDASMIRDTVMEYSADLKNRIDQTLADYGREAQRRDQTYPQRLLKQATSTDSAPLNSQIIKDSLEQMKQRQHEYQELGILGQQEEAPTVGNQTQEENNFYRAAMTLYVQDTKDKLEIIDRLAQRIQLMLTLIRAKFSNKELEIDKKTHDLMVRSTVGKHQSLSVNVLSSGEQHQLVLAYDLLFRTRANTLVLIDEPELSLHVEWQERFLDDLKKVIDLVHFDAVLATHSPFIANGHDELMVGLSVNAV